MKRKANSLMTILFLVYLALLVWIILLKLQFSISDLDTVRSVNFIPFHYDREIGAPFHIREVLENILVFIPMGIYIQMLCPKLNFLTKLMTVMGTSLLLETAQYVLAIGRTDITDLLTNTVGGLLGIIIYAMVAYLLGNKIRANKLFTVIATIVSIIVVGFLTFILFANW